jgi:hypothetical protein
MRLKARCLKQLGAQGRNAAEAVYAVKTGTKKTGRKLLL